MAKKNIGILLSGFLVLAVIIGISVFFMQQGESDPGQELSQSEEGELAEAERQKKSETVMQKKGKPTEDSSVEVEFQEGFSMDELNMTIDELNQLKTYKIKLCADQKGYMDRAAEVLLEDVVSVGKPENTESQKGYGEAVEYKASDGSQIVGDAGTTRYSRGTVPEEVKDIDCEKEINAYVEALDVGLKGADGVTYSVVDAPAGLTVDDPNFARYYIQYYIDGYPISKATNIAYEADDEGYIYRGGNLSGDTFAFENGRLTVAEWTSRCEVYAAERISLQYESLDEICGQLEEKLSVGASGNHYYEVSGVHCSYVIGYTDDVKENNLKELIAVPFLEFEMVGHYYYPPVEYWDTFEDHVIGYNLENGFVSDALVL